MSYSIWGVIWTRIIRILCAIGVFSCKYGHIGVWCSNRFFYPTVTLGYNTETQVKEEIANAGEEQEARWNYVFWLQNNSLCFGIGETAKYVTNWLESNQLPYYEDDDEAWDHNETYDNVDVITKMFVKELICVVKEIHQSGLLTQKYGKEIPIIIHELEYYDEIAEQNIEANGKNLVKEFWDFCMG